MSLTNSWRNCRRRYSCDCVWIANVEEKGLEEVRKMPGLHDEPLKRKRTGQRSVRLGRAYRAIYVVNQQTIELEVIGFAEVLEVHKHRY